MEHHYIPRTQEKHLKDLFESFPVVVVSGARQVGKSTLLTHLYPDLPRIVLDPTIDVENARADPDLFLDNRRPPIILDEIQYAPELASAIKRRLEKDRRPGQYLLTGSQQWNVMRLLAESLTGRVAFIDLEGFSFSEISASGESWLESWLNGEDFDAASVKRMPLPFTLYEQMWRGFLPEAHFLKLDLIPDFHLAYQRTYIERDVRTLSEVADLQLFSRFFRLCGALTAQEINYSEMGREIGITPQTASRWLSILRATFQWFDIPAYSGNVLKRISEKPKGYLADVGLAAALQAISTPEAIASYPLWGAFFETFVVVEIQKQCRSLRPSPHLFHWRTHGGAEVDLLLERNGKFYPIEIKAKSHPTKRDAGGIQAFRKTYPSLHIHSGLIVAPAETFYQLTKTDYVMPLDATKV